MKFSSRFLTILIGLGLASSQVSCQTEEEKAVESVALEVRDAFKQADFDKLAELTHSDFDELMQDVNYVLSDEVLEFAALGEGVTLEEMKDQMLKEFKNEYSDLEIESIDVDGDEAEVVFEDKDGELTGLNLKKENGEWKVYWEGDDLDDMQEMAEVGETIRFMIELAGEYSDDDYTEYGYDDEDVFYCNNGREIPYGYLNDGDCDCNDCEDENVFFCGDGLAITRDWVYDGECDCDDCSDE
jgi:hypothetical protein